VVKAGVRAVLSKGWLWSKVGNIEVPDNVLLIGNVPHDWLFRQVSAVVHHGGAGTCAAGIALGKPTVIVPFFGDQFFWAGMISRAGAGPEGVPYKQLTADKLAESIRKALHPDVAAKAKEMAEKMRGEDGVRTAAAQFHSMPQMKGVSCFLCPNRIAAWRVRGTNIQLSCLAAVILARRKMIRIADLKR